MFSSTVSDTRDINDTKKTTHKQRKLINKKLCSNNEQSSRKNTVRVDYQKLIFCIATGGQLGDEHINATNLFLRSQFPDLQGLCTPVLGQRLSFPEFNAVQGYVGFDYFQVLHTGSDHWVTVQILSQEEA